jgi:hypothetical protein
LLPTTPSATSRKKRRGETIIRNDASGQYLTATTDPKRLLKRGRPGCRKNTTQQTNTNTTQQSNSKEVQEETFWESGEALKWFGKLLGEEGSNLDIRKVVEK